MKLIIGNKSVSSWSMRPWILLKHYELPFEEILVKLDLPDTTENILRYSPTGKVPALIDGDLVIWESVAIMEYLNEKFPDKQMYPTCLKDRALARSWVMEMHAGFFTMRELLSFNVRKRHQNFDWTPARKDIERVKLLWNQKKGEFLFGDFGLIDAMYAPVVARFQTYGVPLEGRAQEYYETMLNLPAFKAWYLGASQENFEATKHN